MAVRETLELDIRKALASVGQLSAALDTGLKGAVSGGAATGLNGVNTATRNIAASSTVAATGLSGLGAASRKTTADIEAGRVGLVQYDRIITQAGRSALIGGAAIAAGLTLAFNASKNFEQSLSTVAAVSDATAGQLDKLRTAAILAGEATVFSAKDAADAEGELAKAGLSVRDILGGALVGSLNLASAGQLGLAEAATIAAQAMQIFGLRGSDVSHIADVLAAGANKSTASVASLGQGLGNVGGVARLFNLSLEETVGGLALLDQNAVKGAEGGTALRSALLALATPSKIQADTTRQLNLQFFDAQGKFVGLAGVADELRVKLKDLTDQQRTQALGIIFGSFGIQAASALYREGGQSVRDYTKAVNDNGAAQRFASTQLDNLAGDLEQLKGSIETGLIQTGGRATPVLRALAQGATGVVNGLSGLPPITQSIGVGLAAVSAAALLAAGSTAVLSRSFTFARTTLTNFGAAGTVVDRVSTGLANNLNNITKASVGLAAFFAIAPQLREVTGGFEESGAAAGALSGAMFGIPGIAVGAVLGGLAGKVGLLGNESDRTAGKIKGMVGELEKLTGQEGAKKFLDSFKDLFNFDPGTGGKILGFFKDPLNDVDSSLRATQLNVKELRKQFSLLGTQSPAAARQVLAGLELMQREGGKPLLDPKVVRQLKRDLSDADDAFARANVQKQKSDEINRKLAGSEVLLGDAAEQAAKDYEQFVAALVAGVPTTQSLLGDSIKAAQDFAKENERAFDPAVVIEQLAARQKAIFSFTANLRVIISEGLINLAQDLAKLGPEAAGQLTQALVDGTPATRRAAEDQSAAVKVGLSELTDYLSNDFAALVRVKSITAGQEAGLGFAAGVGSAFSLQAATEAAQRLAEITDIALRQALAIESPSKLFRQHGRLVAEGFALGISDTQGLRMVAKASAGMGRVAAVGLAPGIGSGASSVASTQNFGPISITVTGVDPASAYQTGQRIGLGLRSSLATARREIAVDVKAL